MRTLHRAAANDLFLKEEGFMDYEGDGSLDKFDRAVEHDIKNSPR